MGSVSFLAIPYTRFLSWMIGLQSMNNESSIVWAMEDKRYITNRIESFGNRWSMTNNPLRPIFNLLPITLSCRFHLLAEIFPIRPEKLLRKIT